MEKELELIAEYCLSEERLNELRLKSYYAKDGKKESLQRDVEAEQDKLQTLEKKLVDVEEKSFTKRKKEKGKPFSLFACVNPKARA